MDMFDNLAKAAKEFFVETDEAAGRPAPAGTGPVPFPVAPGTAGAASPFGSPAAVTQAEQRHLDHIGGLLAGNGKDFAAYAKMVKSMAAAGMSGPLLYQTAFNAFAAINGSTVPGLLTSANEFEAALAADRDRVLARHREKMGETPGTGAAPSAIAQLTNQEKQLAADLTALSQQLQAKQQQLAQTQQQLAQERQKTQAALASYELAQSGALAELQAHHKAAEAFLLTAGAAK